MVRRKTLSRYIFAFFVTVAAGDVVAQERPLSVQKFPAQTLSMKPGFQQNITLQGSATIAAIQIGDDTVARVTVVSDKQFLITALPAKPPASPLGIRQTNILVRDPEQNVIANLEVVVKNYDDAAHEVEIHKPIKGAGGQQRIGVDQYQCSSVKCTIVKLDQIEPPTIRYENTNTNTNITTGP